MHEDACVRVHVREPAVPRPSHPQIQPTRSLPLAATRCHTYAAARSTLIGFSLTPARRRTLARAAGRRCAAGQWPGGRWKWPRAPGPDPDRGLLLHLLRLLRPRPGSGGGPRLWAGPACVWGGWVCVSVCACAHTWLRACQAWSVVRDVNAGARGACGCRRRCTHRPRPATCIIAEGEDSGAAQGPASDYPPPPDRADATAGSPTGAAHPRAPRGAVSPPARPPE